MTIGARALAIVAGVLVVAYLARRKRPMRAQLSLVASATVAALTVVVAAGQITGSVASLSQQRNAAVAAEPGRDECVSEQTFTPGSNLYTQRVPFAVWARKQMGRNAVYSLASFTAPPDDLCLYFVLLPALPAAPGERPDWTLAFGSIPAEMGARIAAHDPSVKVFAPGFALQSDGPR